ncbi:conserved hypothetical protein [Ricinus communis]|uniref:Uncharacterized protein n=1 Tax=Ricinus communis TaxID=3988 RepID=B9T1T0_RICCO|nr:conserved hypothetical protein [Ricinus communis]
MNIMFKIYWNKPFIPICIYESNHPIDNVKTQSSGKETGVNKGIKHGTKVRQDMGKEKINEELYAHFDIDGMKPVFELQENELGGEVLDKHKEIGSNEIFSDTILFDIKTGRRGGEVGQNKGGIYGKSKSEILKSRSGRIRSRGGRRTKAQFEPVVNAARNHKDDYPNFSDAEYALTDGREDVIWDYNYNMNKDEGSDSESQDSVGIAYDDVVDKNDGLSDIEFDKSRYLDSSSKEKIINDSGKRKRKKSKVDLFKGIYSNPFQRTENGDVRFEVRQVFSDVVAFRYVLRDYLVKGGSILLKCKNELAKAIVICAEEDCPWRVYALVL